MSDDDRMDALLRQMAAEEYNRPPEIVPRELMWDVVQQELTKQEPGIGTGRVLGFSRAARLPRWAYFAAAAVVLLAVGIQIGRRMGAGADSQIVAVPRAPATRDGAAPTAGGPDAGPLAPPNERQVVVVPDAPPARSDDGSQTRPRPGSGPERAPRSDVPDDASSRAYTVAATQHLTEAEALLTVFKGDLSQGRMDAQIASWGKDLLSNTRLLLDSPAARDPARRKLLQDLELVLVQIVQLSPGAPARDRDLIKGALTDDQVLTRLRTALPIQKGT